MQDTIIFFACGCVMVTDQIDRWLRAAAIFDRREEKAIVIFHLRSIPRIVEIYPIIYTSDQNEDNSRPTSDSKHSSLEKKFSRRHCSSSWLFKHVYQIRILLICKPRRNIELWYFSWSQFFSSVPISSKSARFGRFIAIFTLRFKIYNFKGRHAV